MPPGLKKLWLRRPPRLGRLFDNVRPFYFFTFNAYKRRDLLARPEVNEAFYIFALRRSTVASLLDATS